MTIDKHGNRWRIRQMHDGHLYSISLDHKPTKAEALKLMAKQLDHPAVKSDLTFHGAALAYIDSKRNVLSPATIMGYVGILNQLPQGLCEAHIGSVTALMVQKVINDLAPLKSPKTIANYSAFIMSVLKSADVDIKSPRLPQKQKASAYIPTSSDVRKLLQAVEGTPWEVPYFLAAMGLRRSEICALTLDDLDGCTLRISKAKVPAPEGGYVIKGTKTTDSTRSIVIPQGMADLIRQQGYIYNGLPNMLCKQLHRFQDQLGLPHFTLHKLRHFFASYMHQKGYTPKQIQEAGGWRTSAIMETVYTHAMEMDIAKHKMASDIGGLMSNPVD